LALLVNPALAAGLARSGFADVSASPISMLVTPQRPEECQDIARDICVWVDLPVQYCADYSEQRR